VDEPDNMFGKVMSINDSLIKKYFVLATRIPLEKVDEVTKLPNPRDQKMILAEEITKLYHGEKKAAEAKQAFINQFSKGELPEDIKVIITKAVKVSDALIDAKLASSKSEARRLIEQGGIDYDGKRLTTDVVLEPGNEPKLLRRGRHYVKIQKKK
jgi:tyrosyl-tRNA synthetase